MTANAQLTGPQKAAIAVLALDEELAARVLGQLDEVDLRRLTIAVDELDLVSDEALVAVMEELDHAMLRPASLAGAGARAYMRRLAGVALGEDRAERLFAPPPTDHPTPLEVLRATRAEALADLLVDEHPQIAAVVLTQLPPRAASRVLRELPPHLSGDLLARLSDLDEVPEHAVAEASESVVRALAAAGGLPGADLRRDFDGLAFSAAVVNEMPQEDGDHLLERVAGADEVAAKRIREALFTFEDLLAVDQRQLSQLLRATPGEVLVVALSTAPEELRAHFLGALSKRAADTVKDDLAALAPKRLAEVEKAQREIVDLATRLAAEGTITLPPRGGDDA